MVLVAPLLKTPRHVAFMQVKCEKGRAWRKSHSFIYIHLPCYIVLHGRNSLSDLYRGDNRIVCRKM